MSRASAPDRLVPRYAVIGFQVRSRPPCCCRSCAAHLLAWTSWICITGSRLERLHDVVHEPAEHPAPHVELEARGLEQLRERPAAAERQRGAVALDRPALVLACVAPDLQRADLRDAVLDVIEGRAEDVSLRLPRVPQLILEPGVVHGLGEPAADREPRFLALGPRVTLVRVEPVLERVDRRDPREQAEHRLEVTPPRDLRDL